MIEVKDLAKSFRYDKVALKEKKKRVQSSVDPREDDFHFHAVRNVHFRCEPGKVLGLLGPNGAGKTTTLRMLSTALSPSSGSIIIDNTDVVDEPLVMRRQIGFLSGKTSLYRRLTVRENVRYFGRLHGIEKAKLEEEIDRVFSLLDIHSFENKRAEDLSTGMAQRANIARTVIHSPKVLVLDEPTTGLDVISAKTIVDFIDSYRGSDVSVIFSTHHLHEVESVCDQVTLIDKGQTCFVGTTDEFRALGGSDDLYSSFLTLVGGDASSGGHSKVEKGQ
ncbi:ABC transporter ATP-binding protein [Pleionea litopenaei]|uniref:ATP-binding cassette domain-containing protein n=1 Tax=Pleionea litopenaei TaxID=3070815 RepID=A0AA51X7P7_9GAMM|nr:ATP-binding cassette domain-containing protein [Pleionea sp. HL-JVS1]WMS88552.1 ATP-binding cassette domain-containing protein [Pleionea sp. HL-JVS1]